MNNINTYLKNSNEKLTSDNYNEIDAAVLARLTYMRFENSDNIGDFEDITITEYAHIIKDNKTKYIDEISQDQIDFIENLSNSERYANCTISNFEYDDSLTVNNEDLESQWAAFTVDINDGTDTSVVAMRGTDGTSLGWKEDFELAYDPDGTAAQLLSAEYLKQVEAGNILLTGHSKGGNDVISGYVMSDKEIRDTISRIDNFDGPGVNEYFMSNFSEGYGELGGKLNNYYPRDTVIGRLMIDKSGNNFYVASEIRPAYENMGILGEHDIFSFVVGEANAFVPRNSSYFSEFINDVLDNTVKNLTMEQRENVVNMQDKFGLFSIIAKEDGNVLADLDKNMLEKISAAIDLYNHSSEEEKNALETVGALFIESACDKALNDINEKIVEEYHKIKESIKKKLSDTYDYISNELAKIRDNVEDTLNRVKNGIIEKVDSFTARIENYLVKSTERYHALLDKISGKTGSSFYINIRVVREQVEQLRKNSKKIKNIIREVTDVKSNLDRDRYGANLLAIHVIISNLEKEAQQCEQLAETLEKIVNTYAMTERKLCTQ